MFYSNINKKITVEFFYVFVLAICNCGEYTIFVYSNYLKYNKMVSKNIRSNLILSYDENLSTQFLRYRIIPNLFCRKVGNRHAWLINVWAICWYPSV